MARKKKPRATPAAPGGSEPGREVRPDETPVVPDTGEVGGAMPSGLPIPIEQYEALQEEARHRKPHPPGIVQQDPGAGAGDP